jgi:hypothetical protein
MVRAGRLTALRPTGGQKVLLDVAELDRAILESAAGTA